MIVAESFVLHPRADGADTRNLVTLPSRGTGPDSTRLDSQLAELVQLAPTALIGRRDQSGPPIDEEALFESRLKAKMLIANVAMHIQDKWRASLFRQLDDILAMESWDVADPLPRANSIRTFLRMIVYIRFAGCPGLGMSSGDITASWTSGDRRLTVDCQDFDQVRWIFSHRIEDIREVTSGITRVTRLPTVLAPYSPNEWLFNGGHQYR